LGRDETHVLPQKRGRTELLTSALLETPMRHPALAALLVWGAVFASYSESPGQSGWVWQNPSPQGNDLGGIHVFSRDVLLLIGDISTFLLSTDGGQNWQPRPGTGAQFEQLHAFHFIDPTTAFLVADTMVFKTTNGSNDWFPIQTGQVIASSFHNGREGCLLMASGSTGSNVLHTLDGGTTWTSQHLAASFEQACMAFPDSLHGLILGYQGELYTTSNGGASWTDKGYASYWGNLALYFFNNQTGWLVGEGANICKTTNGGQSWTRQYTGNNWETLRGIYFKNTQQGWAWGPGLFLRTTNGGISWSNQSKPVPEDIQAIQFADSTTGWAIGRRGTILRSTNAGVSWTSQSKQFDASTLDAVQFVSENEGWFAGHDLSGSRGVIFHSTNGGATWTSQANNLPGEGTSIYFVNRDTGWVSTASPSTGGTIFKTTDGGATWVQKAAVTTPLREVKFTSPRAGWALGDGSIFKTTDAGESWVQQETGFDTPFLQSCDFRDSLSGWVLGLSTTGGTTSVLVANTTDGGATWTRHTLGGADNLRSVEFLNARNGWAVGAGEAIYGTSDGGQSWTLQHRNPSSGATLNSVAFADSMHGWAAGGSQGSSGVILQTTNGGRSWLRSLVSEQPILKLWFSDATKGWAVGEGGTILKTTSGGVVLSLGKTIVTVPEGFCLFQNYPNPFNPRTGVRFQVPGVSDVNIAVYDILGREVAVLVHERKLPGSYEVTFDGSGLASGVYFYRLTAGTFAQTRKLVLLR
jgi:photosystem II stability/assembly factor-like uncharacterized protein